VFELSRRNHKEQMLVEENRRLKALVGELTMEFKKTNWFSKKVVGHYMGFQAKSCHWQEALERAVARQFPDDVREHKVHLMSDNGCQPTAVSFMKACRTLGIEQAFTSYNNPKGNADTERFMRTLKEELVRIPVSIGI